MYPSIYVPSSLGSSIQQQYEHQQQLEQQPLISQHPQPLISASCSHLPHCSHQQHHPHCSLNREHQAPLPFFTHPVLFPNSTASKTQIQPPSSTLAHCTCIDTGSQSRSQNEGSQCAIPGLGQVIITQL